MQWLLIPFVLLTGVLNALQTGMNTKLGQVSGAPIVAALAVYVVGFGTLAVLAPFLGAGGQAVGRLGQAPWWAWLGGIGGALYIVAMLYATDKVGAGVFTGITVTAAIVTSVVLDHFGWLGLKEHAAGVGRIAGSVLMIAGVVLVAKF
jgi:transporter family-2 protein